MKDGLWRQLEPLADRTYEVIERFLSSPQASDLTAIIQKAEAVLPECIHCDQPIVDGETYYLFLQVGKMEHSICTDSVEVSRSKLHP